MASIDPTKPRYSKNTVNRAGEVLVGDSQNEDALEVLEYWRVIHAEPLDLIVGTLIGETAVRKKEYRPSKDEPDYTTFVTSRLKRSVSIINKLKNIPSMKLSRMQDIAGLRYSFGPPNPPQDSLEWFQKNVQREKNVIDHIFSLKKTDDYVETPRESGYRAVHCVFEFKDPIRPINPAIPLEPYQLYDGLSFEIQFRTRLQHLWAMAVETVGMFYGQALKASQGDQGWLDFFKLASAAISHLENAPVVAKHAGKSDEEIRRELRQEGTEKSFFTKLAAIPEIDRQDSAGEYDYWLLEVNIKKGTNAIYGFKADQIETAHEMYTAKEQTPTCLRGDSQVVLVSTQSFKDLREAYPSYFLDVADFIAILHNICQNN